MKKRIITISREFGSGGRFIGGEAGKKLLGSLELPIMTKISSARLQKSPVCLRNIFRKMQNYLRRKDYLHMHLPDVISQENP